jgi:signal transduction histidine kinase
MDAGVLLTLLVRTLRLERAALLLADDAGRELRLVATHGTVRLPSLRPGDPPGDGPWSFVGSIPERARLGGLLVLDRGSGAALSRADAGLAAAAAGAIARVVEHGRLDAEIARLHQVLAHADRLSAVGTLAAGVAHEIRNPLVSVRTFIQLLPERLADEEFRTGFRELALTEIDRICVLINDLLSFARPAPEQREPTDLPELVGQITHLLEAEARKQDVVVVCRTESDLPLVTVDEAQVKQVVLNVLLNAMQASGSGGRVEIRIGQQAHDDGHWCVVTVADSGSGIPPEHAERIFDPFFTTKDSGSGLGLFIAHQIVVGHGGYICTTPRTGGGTEFSIHLPLGAEHAIGR